MDIRGFFSRFRAARNAVVAIFGKGDSSYYREFDNPLRGLTVASAVGLMESYNTGDFADLMWLFAAPFLGIENSDADYFSILERRIGAMKEMNYRVAMWKPGRDEKPDPVKSDRAQKQFDVLNNEYERYENIKEAIGHLALAKFRGFSILEPNPYDAEFIPVDHWNVRRDGMRGGWYWNESGLAGADIESCTPFDPERIIVLETSRPIGRIALLKYIRANLSEKEWDRFVEIYGVPAGVVIAPDNVNDAGKLAQFREAAARAAKGGDAAFPYGTSYTPNDSPRGIQPFQARLEWLSQKLVQAGTGGYLTMLSMSGSGTLAGSAHMEAFRILSRADAADITEAFQKQFDKRVLTNAGLLLPGQRPLAWFEISSREEQSTKEATDQVIALSAQFDLDPMQVEERTGWKVTKKEQPLYPAGGTAGMFRRLLPPSSAHRGDPVPAAKPDDVEAAAAALMADLAPLRDLLGEALRDCGGDLRAAIQTVAAGIPGLAEKMTSGELDAVLESATAQAMADVLEYEATEGSLTGREGKGA